MSLSHIRVDIIDNFPEIYQFLLQYVAPRSNVLVVARESSPKDHVHVHLESSNPTILNPLRIKFKRLFPKYGSEHKAAYYMGYRNKDQLNHNLAYVAKEGTIILTKGITEDAAIAAGKTYQPNKPVRNHTPNYQKISNEIYESLAPSNAENFHSYNKVLTLVHSAYLENNVPLDYSKMKIAVNTVFGRLNGDHSLTRFKKYLNQ